MKKTININLGGHPFTIDLDAYEKLEKYLNSLETYFMGHEGNEEILEDIELRLAELFSDEIKSSKIVSIKNVETVISTMGTVEDLGGEEMGDNFFKSDEDRSYRTGRRLFRDEDRGIIGGVCAGLSTYLGIKNPWWIRLAFIFIPPLNAFVYILLWILVPAAVSSSDRLAMQGEPINISTIVQSIEDELIHIKDKIGDLGRDLKSRGKKK